MPAVAETACEAAAKVGASLTGVTKSRNPSDVNKAPSLALIVRSKYPLASLGGVPEKVRVIGLNCSHEGKAEPSLTLAE